MRHENLRGYVVVAVDPVAGLGDDDETFLTDMADSTIFALHGLRQGTDICESEEKRGVLQGQFQQSQKMEVVGRLAGGVAHDFNNLLTVILGSCDFLLRDLPADDPGRLDVEQIRSTGERAANLTRQLLAFSRKQILQPTTLDLNAVLTNTEKLLRRLIGEDVALSVCYGQDMSLIKADQGQLEQVVMNLAVNARDAMPKGGRLAIETRDLRLSDAQTLMRDVAVPPGRYALLTVEDTGTGMSPETLEHVFEPFFTTKGLGKGTGLGLATVYGVIKQSGGFIDIQSGLGRGTTFKIFLPVAPDSDLKAAPERADGRPEERPAGASRNTILLVEDETTVRRLIRRILVNAGYAVLEAASAQEALELSGKDFDLVLTDIVLPDVSGVELTAKLQKMRPIQALYMSGYTESPNILDILAQPGNRFLQKPFTTKALLDMIQDILAKNPAP
jgi:signal transduction histidine kinase/CheY-like chemotaxis protein